MPQSQLGSFLRSRQKVLWESPLPFSAHPSCLSHPISPVSKRHAPVIALLLQQSSELSVLFVAGDAKVYERILDYNKIVEALNLPKGLPDANPFHSRPCKDFKMTLPKVLIAFGKYIVRTGYS